MNKRGFTLIELLTIIAILAVIALITTPIITNVVESSQKRAFKESANGLIRAAKLYYSEQVEEAHFYGKIFDFSKKTNELSFNGKKPKSGTLVMDSDGLIKINVTNGTYCASKDFESNEVVVTKSADCTNTNLEPEITMSALTEGTKRIIVKAQCTEEGNTTIKKYEFKIGDKWLSNGKDYYIFDDLESNKEYIVSARCVNSIGIVAEKSLNVKTSLILAPTISITPETEYATERIVTLNYPKDENGNNITGRFKYEYSIDEGETWEAFEDGLKLEYNKEEDNGKLIIAKVTDSKNTYSSNAIISGIDTTEPELVLGTVSTTTNSITIPYTAIDNESGIENTKCKYKTGDGSYTSENVTISDNKCKITGLADATLYDYQITTTNRAGKTISKEESAKTENFAEITITSSNKEWTMNKTVTISGTTAGATLKYKLVSGTTTKKDWTEYTGAIIIDWPANEKTPTYIYAKLIDGTNESDWTTLTLTTIDTTAPTSSTFSYTKTSKSITVVASGTDAESGIYGYQFSKDNGSTWTSVQTTNNYTFNDLTAGTYNIKVRVINKTYTNDGLNNKNYLNSSTQSISTTTIEKPTYSVSNSTVSNAKIVTITYPSGYKYEYSLDGGKTWKTSSTTTKKIEFQTNGTVIARVNDGKNYVTASTYTVSGIDNTPIGTILIYSGKTIPTGYLECNGQAVSRTTYSKLFSVIGTKYGSGDGSTTFNLPNLSGRVAVGKGTGTDANSTSKTFTQGSKGGKYSHALTTAELPSHTHTYTGSANTVGNNSASMGATFTGTTLTLTDYNYNWHTHSIINRYGGGDFTVGNAYGGGSSGIPLGSPSWSYNSIKFSAAHWFTGVYYFAYSGNHRHYFIFSGTVSINYSHNHSVPTLTGSNSSKGSGSKHNNIQPYVTVPYIIKY